MGLKTRHMVRMEAPPPNHRISEGPMLGFCIHTNWPSIPVLDVDGEAFDQDFKSLRRLSGWYLDSTCSSSIYPLVCSVRIPRRLARQDNMREAGERSPVRQRWVAANIQNLDSIVIGRTLFRTRFDARCFSEELAKEVGYQSRKDEALEKSVEQGDSLTQAILESQGIIDECRTEIVSLGSSHAFARAVLNDRIESERVEITKNQARIEALKQDFWKAVA